MTVTWTPGTQTVAISDSATATTKEMTYVF